MKAIDPTINDQLKAKYSLPVRGRTGKLSREEAEAVYDLHFTQFEQVKINFLPMVMQSLVIHAATDLADLLAERRIDGLKQHTRMLRESVKKFDLYEERQFGRRTAQGYERYCKMYRERVDVRVWLMRLGLREQARNENPGKDADVCAVVMYVALISQFVRKYIENMNEMIAERTGLSVRRKVDVCPTVVYALCVDIADAYGFALRISEDACTWVKILGNEALALCTQCFNEEKEAGII